MSNLRTKFLDYDARKLPKTDRFCIMCQRDLKPNQPCRSVHLINGTMLVLHPGDEAKYTPNSGDMGSHLIGMDCARKLGMEWTREEGK